MHTQVEDGNIDTKTILTIIKKICNKLDKSITSMNDNNKCNIKYDKTKEIISHISRLVSTNESNKCFRAKKCREKNLVKILKIIENPKIKEKKLY